MHKILFGLLALAVVAMTTFASAQDRSTYVILGPDGHPPATTFKPIPRSDTENGPGTPTIDKKNPNVEYKRARYEVVKAGWYHYPEGCFFIDCAVLVGENRSVKPTGFAPRSAGSLGFGGSASGIANLLFHEEGGYLCPFPVKWSGQYPTPKKGFGEYAKRTK